LEDEQVEKIITKVKNLADKQKNVERDDIIAIAASVAGALSKEDVIVELDEVKIITGNKTKPKATVSVIIEGDKKIGKGEGVGPVDAVSHAIKNIVGGEIELKEYNLKAITGGTDALADVTIAIEDKKGNIFRAQGINEDVIIASAIALVKGLNKALIFKKKIHGE
ncbi:MAG: 2-isopropylmalate synthase, partial [Thermodesulfovibrionia bacterium]|nr:2-isopropylmalate synthase [Thermodesulfovibrionia bacterium]